MEEKARYLEDLLERSKSENRLLEEMAQTYFDLIASGNREWVDKYFNRVCGAVEFWIDDFRLARSLYHNVRGYTFYMRSRNQEGLDEFKKAISFCDETALFNNVKGKALIGASATSRSLGNLDDAVRFAFAANDIISEEGPARDWHGYVKGGLAEIHAFIGEYEQSEQYLTAGLRIAEKLRETVSPTSLFRMYIDLGVSYTKMDQKERSIGSFNKALEVKGISKPERSRALCDLGAMYLDDPEKALEYLDESCAIRKDLNLEDPYSTSLLYKGECLLRKGDLKEASVVIEEGEEIVNRFKVPVKLLHLYRLKMELNKALDDCDGAAKYYDLYDGLREKIGAEQVKNILRIKNNLIADQHKEIEQKHSQLRRTLEELARIKVSRKALLFSIITVVGLVIITELFLDPVIEEYSGNSYLGLAAKVLIAFLLKPIDTLYERLLFRRAVRE